MSEEKEKKEIVVQSDHDLDSLEVRILFLVEHPNQMHASTSFLNRRGWKTEVTKDAAQTLRLVSKEKFDYVLISVNHPNPKVTQLCMLIPSSFNTPVVSIAEKADSKSIGLLNAARTAEKLLGRISGPAIHRKIRQLLAIKYGLDSGSKEESRGHERQTDSKAQDTNRQSYLIKSNTNQNEGNDYIRFKREAAESGYIQINQTDRKSNETQDEALEEFEKVEDENLTQYQENASQDQNYKEEKASAKGIEPLKSGSKEEVESGVYIQKGVSGNFGTYKPEHSRAERSAKNSSRNENSEQNEFQMDDSADEKGSFEPIPPSPSQLQPINTNVMEIQEGASSGKFFVNPQEVKKTARLERTTWLKSKEFSDQFSPVRDAFEIVAANHETPNEVIKISKLTNTVGVIPISIKTEKFFVIVNHSGDASQLEERLFDFYIELHQNESGKSAGYELLSPFIYQGEAFSLEELISLKGLASYTDIIGDHEMSVSVVQRSVNALTLEIEPLKLLSKKIKFDHKYLKPEVEYDFHLFIQLNPSMRYIKYIKPGGRIYEKQKEKLANAKANLFVDTMEYEAIEKLLVTIELQELLSQTLKKSAA